MFFFLFFFNFKNYINCVSNINLFKTIIPTVIELFNLTYFIFGIMDFNHILIHLLQLHRERSLKRLKIDNRTSTA